MDSKLSFKDNSRLKEFKKCPRSYFFQYVKDLKPNKLRLALDFGTSWHAAMDVIYPLIINTSKSDREITNEGFNAFSQSWVELGHPLFIDLNNEKEYMPRTPGVAKEMLHNYIKTRREWIEGLELIDVELPFAIKLDPTKPWRYYVGRWDKVVKEVRLVKAIEHKSTTMYAVSGGIQPSYIEAYQMDAQPDGYSLALSIAYKGMSGGVIIDTALVHKQHHDIFRFIPVNKGLEQANTWLEDTIYWWNKVDEAEELGHYPRNAPGGCRTVFGRCDYWSVCLYTTDIHHMDDEPNGYIKEKWEPFSFDELEKAINSTKGDIKFSNLQTKQ